MIQISTIVFSYHFFPVEFMSFYQDSYRGSFYYHQLFSTYHSCTLFIMEMTTLK